MRVSNEKIIKDEEKFNQFFPQYQSIITRLTVAYPIDEAGSFGNLVNFQKNLSSPKHNWYEYKQGYSEELVRRIIEASCPSSSSFILDPFCGVGTTNLTAQSLGYKSIGIDVNPMAILATELKTHHFNKAEITEIKKRIESFELPLTEKKILAGKVIETSFTSDVLSVLLKIRYYIEQIEKAYIQRFFRLALISILDICSLKVKDGNGLKFKKKYTPVLDLVGLFLDKCKQMISDIESVNYKAECKCLLGSILNDNLFSLIESDKVSLCVFSPPYANCFDYCEVYKLELWIGGFVKSYEDFEKFRSMALRSHVNSKFNHSIRFNNQDVDIIATLISAFNIWNKNIPDMIRGYFDDMELLLKRVYYMLEDGGRCYIVVANSAYKGILVPTDMLLANIAEQIGYEFRTIHVARKIRSSSQQMKGLYETYDNLMRESIVVLEK